MQFSFCYRHTAILVLLTLFTISFLVESKPSKTAIKNHELLTKLGLSRVRGPNNHQRKRVAVESRHHSRSDDSHMFIIKLPPNPHYYVHNRPNTIVEPNKKVPVGFKSNGKPGKIYHWNIPVIKKIVASKNKSRVNDDHVIDIQNPAIWNEVLDKPSKEKKPMKPYYYVPAKSKKSPYMNHFAGNGKPHSFYVIEKSRKAHYHKLLP